MKRSFLFFVVIATFALAANGQPPKSMKYQTVIRDASGEVMANQQVNLTIKILQGSENGTEVCSETFTPTTNEYGLVNLEIGSVNPTAFSAINWANGPYFTKVELNGNVMGCSELLSVPYALYSEKSNDSYWEKVGSSIFYDEGRVGIGCLSPSCKFDIKEGNSCFQYDGSIPNVSYLRLGSEAVNNIASAKIQFVGWGILHGGLSFIPRDLTNNQGKFIFSMGTVDDPTSQSPYMTIQQGGKVGIGTTNPLYQLHVKKDQNQLLLLEREGLSAFTFGTTDDGNWNVGIGESKNINFYTNGANRFTILASGNVGIGTSNPSAKLHVAGRTKTEVLEITGGSDLAEPFPMHEELLEGSVVIIDENNPGHLVECTLPYDKRVAGIVSGAGGVQPGLTLKQEGVMEGTQNIALTGRVYVRATTENGVIKPGDRLTSSKTPGHAMKAKGRKAGGTVIGKAMSSLEEGTGLVLVLVNLQ